MNLIHVLFNIVVVLIAGRVTAQSNSEDETPLYNACCSLCMEQTLVAGLDVVNFDKCSKAQEPCCFNCSPGKISQPQYALSGATGHWNGIEWNNITKVTYVVVKEGENKTTQPTFDSSPAEKVDNMYYICTIHAGTVYFRAFKDSEGCTASYEFSLKVEEGGSSCPDFKVDEDEPTVISETEVPSPSESEDGSTLESNTNNQLSCSGNSYIYKNECVCESGYTGAPACTEWPAWRWAITICGGVAAVVSISVSAHAFIHRRKIQKQRKQKRTQLDIAVHGGTQLSPKAESLEIGGTDSQASTLTSYSYKHKNSAKNIKEVTL